MLMSLIENRFTDRSLSNINSKFAWYASLYLRSTSDTKTLTEGRQDNEEEPTLPCMRTWSGNVPGLISCRFVRSDWCGSLPSSPTHLRFLLVYIYHDHINKGPIWMSLWTHASCHVVIGRLAWIEMSRLECRLSRLMWMDLAEGAFGMSRRQIADLQRAFSNILPSLRTIVTVSLSG